MTINGNHFYEHFRARSAKGELNWEAIAVKGQLVNITTPGATVYAPNFNSDTSLADIAAGARIGSPGVLALNANRVASILTGGSFLGGVLDADDLVLNSVSATTDNAEALVLYYDDGSGIEANFTLILYLDNVTGLPIVPNGAPITIVFDGGNNRIGRL